MMLAGLVTSALLLTPAAASASSTRTCRSDNGTNVNAYFGIPRADAIWLNLQGQRPPCLTVVRGNPLVRTHGWIAQLPPGTIVDGERIQTVYPEGYEPDHPAPMRDFLSKLTQARYVISRDGTVELTRTVTGRELFAHAKLGRFGDLSVGQHTIEIYWTLRERHCDGFAADPANNCLPAGESLTTSTVFDVVRRR
jgi:hypothetical protein